jgi:hypothetical protein
VVESESAGREAVVAFALLGLTLDDLFLVDLAFAERADPKLLLLGFAMAAV